MPIESVTHIDDLVVTNPLGADSRTTSDDHHRLIKSAVKQSLPNSSAPSTPNAVSAGGTANAQTVTLTPAPAAYESNMYIRFWPVADNTGATNLDVNSLGAKAIVDANGNALVGGELRTTYPSEVVYDGTDFVLINQFPEIITNVLGTFISANAYFDGTDWRYRENGYAALYSLGTFLSGNHNAYVAGSGTAGGVITWTLGAGVDSGGRLDVNTGQIVFPSTQNPSAGLNVLDDYEEGTFTPVAEGTSAAGVGTYTQQAGRYTKVGNKVHFTINLAWNAHTGTGNLILSGLPFNVPAGAQYYHALGVYYSALAVGSGLQLAAYTDAGSDNILLKACDPAGGAVADVAMDTNVGWLMVSGSYEVA